MFKFLTREEELYIKTSGRIEAVPDDAIPNVANIVYRTRSNTNFTMPLFRCRIRESSGLFMVEDLELVRENFVENCEAEYHTMLGLTIKHMESIACRTNNTIIVFYSRLPHCTDWFVELQYHFAKSKERGFRAVKMLRRLN